MAWAYPSSSNSWRSYVSCVVGRKIPSLGHQPIRKAQHFRPRIQKMLCAGQRWEFRSSRVTQVNLRTFWYGYRCWSLQLQTIVEMKFVWFGYRMIWLLWFILLVFPGRIKIDRMDFRSVTVKMNWLKETCRCVCPAALAAFVDMGWSGTHCHKQLWSKSSTPLRKAWSILVNLVRIGHRFQ